MGNSIELRKVNKIYPGAVDTQVLFDIDLAFEEGSMSAVVGESGSGKTTLLNILGTLDKPTSGEVIINGNRTDIMSKDNLADLRNQTIGFVFQFHYLLPEFSVIDNVLMPSSIAGPVDAELRKRAVENLVSLGLDGLADKNANDLSGGQKQRVAIARSLMNQPALILADEPTGNLDTVNTQQVYDLFRKINEERGTAFLIVTHDRNVAQRADRILEVSDGMLVQDVRNQYTQRAGAQTADQVVVAAPVPDHIEIAGHLLDGGELRRLQGLQATAAICTVLEMNRSLTPFYWLNIADPEMPFGGLIEHTNYIPRDRYGGRHILYISNYLFPDHPLYRATKDDVLRSYLPALKRVNPSFDRSWVLASHHVRADYAQPVVTVGYREQIPDMRSSVPGLYLCCMAQIFPEDRGMNYAIVYGDRVARLVMEDLRGADGGAVGADAATI